MIKYPDLKGSLQKFITLLEGRLAEFRSCENTNHTFRTWVIPSVDGAKEALLRVMSCGEFQTGVEKSAEIVIPQLMCFIKEFELAEELLSKAADVLYGIYEPEHQEIISDLEKFKEFHASVIKNL